ncbi:MAG: tRNA pseudouridine(55) synthase TruB [Gemmatimonadetes bacterium]|nr:MAG: tRNA pseudouridine(55) synthase TruB [Gemmatimonadota bacterium]TLY53203.1 MAG: tRNA pseudouridine(55) synthase TruB [Gemmatimonadota bacterium]
MLVAKPGGVGRGPDSPTSHDVVDCVRRALGTDRVGHLGTLDPFAAGLLVVVVGRATRLSAFAAGWDKAYEGVIRLGTTTTTDDATGTPIATSDGWRALERADVEAALARFRGAYEQRPPAYSAVKIAGERAYRRARRGEAVVPASRRVEVAELALDRFAAPDVAFRAAVSSGTYLRSLARDVGEALGCGAHLAALTRTRVGPYRLADAVAPQAVTLGDLRDPAELVRVLPRRDLDTAGRGAVIHGRPIPAGKEEEGAVALFTDGQLVAVAERVGDVLKPRVVVAEP